MIELEKMQRLLEIARCVGHNGISMLATAYKAFIWGDWRGDKAGEEAVCTAGRGSGDFEGA